MEVLNNFPNVLQLESVRQPFKFRSVDATIFALNIHTDTEPKRGPRRVWLIGPNAEARSRRVRRGSGFRNCSLRWKNSFTSFLKLLLLKVGRGR